MIELTVTEVLIEPGSTVGIAIGHDGNGGKVSFAGDWRPMADIGRALAEGEEVVVHVEPWQILSTEEAP